jgi:cobalamin biosynthesis protein CobW
VAEVIARHDLLRVKGFAAVCGKPMRVVLQAVGPRVATHFDRPFGPGEARETRLVVIGETGIDRAAVAEALGAAPVPA